MYTEPKTTAHPDPDPDPARIQTWLRGFPLTAGAADLIPGGFTSRGTV